MSSSSDLSPRAKLNYDSDKFTVEFNVAEYSPEDLHIKTEGDVLIVSAKQESKTSTGKSFVSKQFEQRFSLPSGVNPEKISSKLGVDGVLRISAPRESGGYKRQEALEDSRHKIERSAVNKQSDGLPEPKIKHDKDKLEVQINVSEYKPEDLDVKVENNQLVISAKQETKEAGGGTRTRVFEQKFSLPPGVDPESVKSSLTRDNVLVVTASKEGHQDTSRATRESNADTKSLNNKMDRVLTPSSWDTRRESAFDEVRRDSMSDEKRIMSAFDDLRRDSNKNSSLFDRSLFDDKSIFASNSEQNGISRVEYDDNNYKILVNVDKYNPEEMVIKTIDNTVVVEAKHQEKTSDGRSFSTQSFSQSFTLPQGVDPESVKSSLSQQGVLTISAPLNKTSRVQQERLVPIKHI